MSSSEHLLTEVLAPVSRAFYLTIRVLPAATRVPVGTAYLLARAADTVADTPALEPSRRLGLLQAYRARVAERGQAPEGLALSEAVSGAERVLLESLPAVFALYRSLDRGDGDLVAEVVDTLVSGMELDLETFPPGELRALDRPQDLDRYIYLVAGCVGNFWTLVTARHEPRLADWDLEQATLRGVRFGKALQLTNVLRDLPRDLRNGRCYLPANELEEVGLSPADLLDPARLPAVRPVLERWVGVGLEHYSAAVDYVTSLPASCVRLRLAALWPILIGLATLGRLVRGPGWLEPARVVKVSRPWIYRMLVVSLPLAPFNPAVRWWCRTLAARVVSSER